VWKKGLSRHPDGGEVLVMVPAAHPGKLAYDTEVVPKEIAFVDWDEGLLVPSCAPLRYHVPPGNSRVFYRIPSSEAPLFQGPRAQPASEH